MAAMTSQSIASSPAAAMQSSTMITSSPANNSSSGTGGGGGPDKTSGKCALLNRYDADEGQISSSNRESFRNTPRSRRKVESNPREEMATCRTSGRCCGSIQDLLESFHTAFSDDQIWAIIFQFMNLYRNAITHNGGRGGSTCPQGAIKAASGSMSATTTPRRKSKSGTGSPAVTNLMQKQNKKCNQVTPKSGSPKLNGEGSSGGSSGSDSECPSDFEGSDNSDIRRRSTNNTNNSNGNLIRNSKSNGGGAVVIENRSGGCNSSDEYTDDGEDTNDSDKRSSRLDHVDYLNVPTSLQNFHIHKDGSVHVSYMNEDPSAMRAVSQKQILMKLGLIFYKTMDFHLLPDEECLMSPQLEELMCLLISEDDYDEGIEGDLDTKEMDHILQICQKRINTDSPESHYRAVCRALVAEAGDLKLFLQKILDGGTEQLRINVDAQTSKQELEKLKFNDWARFWTQVLDELRSGIRLKKANYTRAPVEYELTPYEMLMDDIRSKKYRLRKIMINGEIPQRVKNDAHAIILEFIRSRPPLKKASDRKLAPQRIILSAHEELLKSIRIGKELRSTQEKKSQVQAQQGEGSASSSSSTRMTAKDTTESVAPVEAVFESRGITESQPAKTARKPADGNADSGAMTAKDANLVLGLPPSGTLKRNKQRRIEVDYSLFQDDDTFSQASTSSSRSGAGVAVQSGGGDSRKMVTKENDQNVYNVPLRRPTDLGNINPREDVPNRRHTIVGCHQDEDDDDEEDEEAGQDGVDGTTSSSTSTANQFQTIEEDPVKAPEPKEEPISDTDDRLSLTLEEIVHIRSVMTKAELEGLPIEVRIKEDVERRKVCFLCLKTRFSIFGQWGVQCKLCQKTVCAKCYTKMRIPTEHFGNVPVILLSPSLLNSPTTSGTSSPCHMATGQIHNNNYHYQTMTGHSNYVNEMDAFPKTLMERLMRPENDLKKRWAVGSCPASPRHHHISTSSTPGMSEQMATMSLYQAPEPPAMLSSCAKDRTVSSIMSRSMEGPRSLPLQSPSRPHSVTNTLERRSRFPFMSSEQKETLRGELMAVCNDCRGLVLEIIRSSKQQTRSSARNRAIKKLTLDIEPVYKGY